MMGASQIFLIFAIFAQICEGFTRPISPKDIDEWMWKPAWIPPPHVGGEPVGDSLNVRLQRPFMEEEADQSEKADLMPFDKTLDRMYLTEELGEQNELWKLMELNSENERTEPDQAEAEGFSVGGVTANIPTRPTSPTRSATSPSKREKLLQLLQKLPHHKKRRKMRRCGGKRGSGSGLCGKNVKKSSLRGEVKRFADLFEFHRKQQRAIPKGSKRPNIGARGRGARKASAGEKSASMPQKVRRVVGAAGETMRAVLDLAVDPIPWDRGDQNGGVVDYYKIFAVSFATLAAILSV